MAVHLYDLLDVLDLVHELDPVHQVDHKDERCDDIGRFWGRHRSFLGSMNTCREAT